MGWFHFVRRYSYEKIKMQISCNNRLHPAFLFHAACSASPGTGKSLAPLESEAQAVSFAGSERITAYLLRKPQRELRPIESQPTGIENPSLQKAADQSEECWKKLTARLEEQDKILLRRLLNAENEICSTMALEQFILGFRLGARIVLEALDEDNGELSSIYKEE